MRAESYGQLSRLLLERCDGLAASSYCPRLPGVPVAEVFDEERGRVDAVAVHGVRPGSLGKPDGRQVRAGRHRLEPVPRRPRFGAFQGIGRDPVGHGHAHLARHRRAPRGISQTVRTVAQCGGSRARSFPRLAVKPRAWRESSIRPDVPDDIRAWLDSMDEKTLRESLKAIGDACRAAGFDPAMQACGEILRSNRDMGLHADTLHPYRGACATASGNTPAGSRSPT